MFSSFYNLVLLLSLFLFPLRWTGNPFGSAETRERARQRLSGSWPTLPEKTGDRIWVHGVSVGEIKAVSPLVRRLKEEDPTRQFIVTTVTETGMTEAKKAFPFADAVFYFPIDLSFVSEKMVRHLAPTHVLLCETDLWYHFLSAAKQIGAKIAVVNGKISEKSAKRWAWVPSMAKRLFSQVDLFCLQDKIYKERFASLGVPKEKMTVTSNLKFDAPLFPLETAAKREEKAKWHLEESQPVLTIGSTHPGEEKKLLPTIQQLLESIPNLHVFLVPRHPNRAQEVGQLLEKQGLSFSFSSKGRGESSKPVTLVDEMGILASLYAISDACVVGGSFIEGIGGHNIFEPCYCGSPVVFGPHMNDQQEMVSAVLAHRAGLQTSQEQVGAVVTNWLKKEEVRADFLEAGKRLQKEVQGALEKTEVALSDLFPLRQKDLL